MGFMNFLKQAEEKAHAILDKVPTAGLSVRPFNPDGTVAEWDAQYFKNLFTREKAEEWARHMNNVQAQTQRPHIVWKVVDASESHEIAPKEYVASGEVRDSQNAYDSEIVED